MVSASWKQGGHHVDYMHTSMKFLQEISTISQGMRLREDQILFMLSSKLKDLASELDIFIQSATQLNGNWQEAEEIDQNLLRGSKAIADRVDAGFIGLKTRPVDEDTLDAFEQAGYPRPNYVIHFYKIRRGKLARTKMWCNANLGNCRIEGLFVTDQNDQPIPVKGTDVRVVQVAHREKEKEGRTSAF